ncbi:MAG TPA: hypothetical protein VH373_06695 [Jatrophihabitantaceae bacterium]
MLTRSPKRYTVWRSDGGYEVHDADEAGRCVYFSESRRVAREMSKHLNRGHLGEGPPERWGVDGRSA